MTKSANFGRQVCLVKKSLNLGKRKILSYGVNVRVILPEKLAVEIKEEIEMMGRLY